MSELSRDIQALAVDVATLRNEIEHFRAELRAIIEWVLEGNQLYAMRAARSAEGTGPLPGCSHAPDSKENTCRDGPEHGEEDPSDKSTTGSLVLLPHVDSDALDAIVTRNPKSLERQTTVCMPPVIFPRLPRSSRRRQI